MIYREHKNVHHILHLLLTLFFPPWIIIWIARTLIVGQYNRNIDAENNVAQHNELLLATARNKE